MNYAAGLVRECLGSDPPVASQSQLAYTIDALNQIAQAGKANDEYARLTSLRKLSISYSLQGYESSG